MKKVVIKSITITLIIILLVFTLFTLLLCTFFPKTVSNLTYRISAYDISVKYSEKAYQKSNSSYDLTILVERSIIAKNDEVTCKYANTLLVDEVFRKEILPTKTDDYLNYVSTSYVLALYNQEKFDTCIDSAISYTNFSVDEINATTTLISLLNENNDVELLQKLKDKLLQLEQNALTIKYVQVINSILNK